MRAGIGRRGNNKALKRAEKAPDIAVIGGFANAIGDVEAIAYRTVERVRGFQLQRDLRVLQQKIAVYRRQHTGHKAGREMILSVPATALCKFCMISSPFMQASSSSRQEAR